MATSMATTGYPVNRMVKHLSSSGKSPLKTYLSGLNTGKTSAKTNPGMQALSQKLSFVQQKALALASHSLAAKNSELSSTISKLFQANGISTAQPIEIYKDSSGNLCAYGDRSDLVEIDSVLNNSTKVKQLYAMVEAMSTEAHAAQQKAAENSEEVLGSTILAQVANFFSLGSDKQEFSIYHENGSNDLLFDGKLWSATT